MAKTQFISFALSFITTALLCCCAVLNAGDTPPTQPTAPAPTTTPDTNLTEPPVDPNFSVTVSAARNAINVGDPLLVTVTYRWPTGTTVVAPGNEPDPTRDFADIYVTDLPPPQRFSSGEREERIFSITVLAAQQDGSWELPRPTLTIRTTSGETKSTVASVVVIKVGTDSAPPNLPEPLPAWTRAQAPNETSYVWWYVLGAGTIIAMILSLIFARKRQEAQQQSPWDRFGDDWQGASAAGDGKEAGARLSLGLRRCLGTVFRFDGPASTPKETLAFLRQRLPEHEHRELARLLDHLDGLRWAADDLPPSQVRPLLDAGRTLMSAVQARLAAEAEAAQQQSSSAKATVSSHA